MSEVKTMLETLRGWATQTPNEPALHERRADGSWEVTTWKEYWETVRKIGKGLIKLGLEQGGAVAIVGDNRRDWVFCQHGINAAGAIPGPIYTTLLPDQMAYIIDNCQAKIAVCDKQEQLDKYLEVRASGKTQLETIITMDDIETDHDNVISLAKLIEMGAAEDDTELDRRLGEVKPDDIALLIYTSGTTGLPKGAIFTHRGIHRTTIATLEVYGEVLEHGLRYISYLPLCHAAEQGLTNFCGLAGGGKIYFCRDIKAIKDHLVDVEPTTFFAVPRVWEKFEAALRGRLAEATGIKAKLADWALRTELAAFHKEQRGASGDSFFRGLANKLVVSKIKSALGLSQMRMAASGAAPISRSTLEFFASLGIVIHEGYGMTETTAFASVQPYKKVRFGTIGKALPGVKIRIADDGEIMLQGDNMIQGYFRNEEKSSELYDSEGWMHTGDLGALDDEGYLRITGRKKDLIITAGGKNVAPAEMEAHLQSIAGVGQAVVVGDRQPYLSALLVLDPEALPELAKEAGVPVSDVATMATDPKVLAFFQDQVETECNAKVARYQTIKKFEVLQTPFSVETGELTPTLKVKRNVVNEKYASLIAKMYATSKPVVASATV